MATVVTLNTCMRSGRLSNGRDELRVAFICDCEFDTALEPQSDQKAINHS